MYATKPILFGVLSRLFAQSFSVTIADAMQELAAKASGTRGAWFGGGREQLFGRGGGCWGIRLPSKRSNISLAARPPSLPRCQGTLGCVEVGSLNCHWFATKTLARVFQPAADASSPHAPWADTVVAARELLYSGEWRATCSMPTQPSRGDIEKRTQPLLRLGVAVGRGANCLVVEAQAGLAAKGGQVRTRAYMEHCGPTSHTSLPLWPEPERNTKPLSQYGQAVVQTPPSDPRLLLPQSSRLAVKMFSTDHAEGNAQVEAVMREVHVLRQLNHPNIVRLCDVVEMVRR